MPAIGAMNYSRDRLRRSAGFSLIEILAAFSLAAVSIAIIFQIYASGTTAGILGDEYARALSVAESRLELIGTDDDLNTLITRGVENEKYHWELALDKYIADGPVSDQPGMELNSVTVTVSWISRGQDRSISLQTLKPYYPL
jgi:general secretion pathway protein I